MHFVTGGAYNGKRKWVKEYYKKTAYLWLSAYKEDDFRMPIEDEIPNVVVLEGIEQWIRKKMNPATSVDEQKQQFTSFLGAWIVWEKEKHHRQLVMIGADILKGIVPIEETDRTWRDLTGWVYQYLVKQAKQADIIWYGIRQELK